jgi:hypothetical protein
MPHRRCMLDKQGYTRTRRVLSCHKNEERNMSRGLCMYQQI